MASFNKVILLGNLTRDPEVRYTPKGSAVCDLGMAVNRVYTTDSGEKREEVTFVDVVLWARLAEIAGDNRGRAQNRPHRRQNQARRPSQTTTRFHSDLSVGRDSVEPTNFDGSAERRPTG